MNTIFEDFSIAMVQPGEYKNFLNKKKRKVALYVVILITVAALANVLYPVITMGRMAADFYNYDVPYFKVENGEFFIEDDFEIKEKPAFLGLSNDKTYKEEDTDGFDVAVLVDKQNFIVKNNAGVYSYRIKDLGNEISFDKNSLYVFKNFFIIFLVFTGVFMYALSYVGFFIGVLLTKWVSSPFVRVMGININSSQQFRLAIYSRTVPVLLGALLGMWSYGLPYVFSILISEIYLYVVYSRMKNDEEFCVYNKENDTKEWIDMKEINMKNAIKLSPQFKDYLWGGVKLREEFNKNCDYDKIAESWELSTHKDGSSIVASGKYSGMNFNDYISLDRDGILGKKGSQFEFFPILIKFIDAKDSLSIQVHPDDSYALENEQEYGKTEMWYIMDCEEGAYLYYGFKYEITKEEYKKRIEENTLLEVLNKVYVKKGDVFFISSGTVHAIGPGNLICEVQQNSNTTYRVYDYNRKDKNGNTRELHIDKALAVSKLTPPENFDIKPSEEMVGYKRQLLSSCKYFSVEKIEVSEMSRIKLDENTFHSLIILDGEGEIELNGESLSFKKGDSVFIPAENSEIVLKGSFEAMLSYV